VDLCWHYDDDPYIPSWSIFDPVDHGLASMGLIDIVSYAFPVSLRITDHGKEIFEDLRKHDPVSLVNSCMRLKYWWVALYFMQTFLSVSQLPEFLAHDVKEIRDFAAKRLDVLTSCRDAV